LKSGLKSGLNSWLKIPDRKKEETSMSTTTLGITGMTCQHCVMSVTRALLAVPGVQSAEVSLEQRKAVVAGSADLARLVAAVESEGFGAADGA
jgi:copper chaperone CopZ